MNLAGTFAKDKKVLIINGDEQGSALQWARNNKSDSGFPASIIDLSSFKDQAPREIKKYMGEYDFIFVDCPPAVDNPFTSSVLVVANLAIIPIIPSPTDMWAAIGIQKLIKTTQIANEKLNSRIVVNMCKHRTNMAKFAIDGINEFDIEKFNTNIFVRTAYEQTAAFGLTVNELDDVKAKTEIMKLKNEIMDVLS